MVTTKGEATRQRILDATVDLLVVGGRDNVNLDVVLARTRTSKSQLFHYFPNGKSEVLTAATRRQIERVGDAGRLDSWGDWEGWIDGIIRLHRAQLAEDACEVAAIAGRAVDGNLNDRAIIGAALDDWFHSLQDGLRHLQASGELHEDAPIDELAALMLAAIEGAAVLDKATRSYRYMEPALRAALSHLQSFRTAKKSAAGETS